MPGGTVRGPATRHPCAWWLERTQKFGFHAATAAWHPEPVRARVGQAPGRSTGARASSTLTSSMVDGTVGVVAVGHLAHRLAQDLARAGLGQGRRRRRPGAARRPHRSRPAPAAPAPRTPCRRRRSPFDPALQHDEPPRHLTLQVVGDADHRALGDGRMAGQHRLHRPGGEPVAGDVDHVVGAAHDEEVPVRVDVAAVAGQVVAVGTPTGTTRRTARRHATGSAACRAASAA